MEQQLPKNWENINFTEIFDINGGTQPPKSQFIHEPKEGYIRLLQIRDFGKKPVPTYIPDTGKLRTCEKDDILIARYGASIGRIVSGQEGSYNVALAKVNIPETMNKSFVKWLLKSHIFQNKIISFQRTAQSGFNKDDLSSIKIPLPPLAEQQRIVKKLDELFKHLDQLNQRLETIPQLLKQFKQAVLTQAVTGKLTEEWRVGKELEEWKDTTIGEFMIEVKNKMNPMESDATNYIGLEHLSKDGGIINKSSSENLKSSKTVFKKGDVLYGKLRPYLNKHDVVTFDGVCSTDILAYRNDNQASSYFFNYYLGTESFIQKANSESKGINLPRVSSKTINQFNINVPPTEEQTEIVKRVEHLFAKADKIENQYPNLKAKTDQLPQAILAKAFKGELVAQLPTDGDAKDLLEEIKQLKTNLSKTNKKAAKKKK